MGIGPIHGMDKQAAAAIAHALHGDRAAAQALLSVHAHDIRTAITIKFVEERLLQLFGEGKLFGTVHTCIGQEFSAVAVTRCLQPQDFVFSNHRCHGHFLGYGGSADALIAEVMGKAGGVCGGRGGSQHLCYKRFFSNGIQGGIVPLAAGAALAQQGDRNDGIAVVFLGDGTLGEGVVYETLNIASKWGLPLLCVVENNRYAQSTAVQETLAGSIEQRFEAFGIAGRRSNTWDWPALFSDMAATVAEVRDGLPRYHIIDTYRLKPHSKGDDFRERSEIDHFAAIDPLNQLLTLLADTPEMQAIVAQATAIVDGAVAFGESSPFGSAEPAFVPAAWPSEKLPSWKTVHFQQARVPVSIRAAFDAELARNADFMLIGEDIQAPYGGAFKVTGDLGHHYPAQVRNTPISEAAIVGIGNGFALAGHRPVVEIMFGDFLTLAADQWINHAAKFEYMYAGQAKCPVVIRTPMGGRRGYGPTHSQSLERHFVGLPGTHVLCLHHRMSPRALYQSIFSECERPVLVLENKRLYAAQVDSHPPEGFELLEQDCLFPTTWLSAGQVADVTVLAIGGTSIDAEAAVLAAFDQHDVVADLFMPTSIYPLDVAFLGDSLLQSRRLLVVEEGLGFAGLASELMAQVMERWPEEGIRCSRLTSKESPIPTSRPLEEAVLPDQDSILKAILHLAHA